MSPQREKPHIGWREWVALPELRVQRIKAKIDTGARTSALHAIGLERFRRRGADMARFTIYPIQRSHARAVHVEVPVVDERPVRSSSGHTEHRPVIVTPAKLLDQEWDIEITLTSRDAMGFRMLLGRQAVRKRFLIDAGHSYLGGVPSRR